MPAAFSRWAMNLFQRFLHEVTNDLFGQQPVQRKAKPVRLSMPTGGKTVLLDNTPLHSKRGWTVSGKTAEGYYRTRYGAWKGTIERKGDKFRVYILDPPMTEIEYHERRVCFYKRGGGKWEINLALHPKDRSIDSVIWYVERVIYESYDLASR